MAKPSRFEELTNEITPTVVAHPRDLTRVLAQRLGVSRVRAASYVRQLEREGWISRSGPSTHPVFSPGFKHRVFKLYPLKGLEEDAALAKDFRPYFNLAPNVQNIVGHGFTEMVNNAIDHSGGTNVFVWMSQSEAQITLIVRDNGIGIFKKIADALALPDMRLALFELSKGKLTTDPSKHSGEGVFFTSRMFDYFAITANNLIYDPRENVPHDTLDDAPKAFERDAGTSVHMNISLNSQRTTTEVYEQFTEAPENFDFSKTVVPMKLAQFGEEQLIARSQAKRLIARFDRFKIVVLDFKGVHEIGQAFADELFRVYGNSHPEVELVPQNMTGQVERMWLRVMSPDQ